MNYCGECEHSRGAKNLCHFIAGGNPANWRRIFPDSPACRKFSAKKRTCGECEFPYWKASAGLCTEGWNFVKYPAHVTRSREACGGFKGEAE